MYVPDLNQIQDISVIRGLIRTYPLATVLTIGGGGLEANHIPLILHEREDGCLLLQGHVARNNPPRRGRLATFECASADLALRLVHVV